MVRVVQGLHAAKAWVAACSLLKMQQQRVCTLSPVPHSPYLQVICHPQRHALVSQKGHQGARGACGIKVPACVHAREWH